tara:strand:+ start:629 stop:826 length:198 start_codon:yes stop_codon:yes gene_type:complete
MPSCSKCGNTFNKKRANLGYKTCLACGDVVAAREIVKKSRSLAPAFNKGPYTYIFSREQAKNIGR